MSLSKIPFLLTGVITTYFIQTPPQATVSVDQRDKNVGTFESIFTRAIPYTVAVVKTWTSVPLLIEVVITIANCFPSHDISQWILRVFTKGHPGVVQRLVLSPTFLATCAIGVAAGAFRYQCYRILGKYFTYELTVRNGQKLVTEGPYSYVRHPSYTGYILGTSCVGLMPLMRGSWLRESGILREPLARVPWVIGALWAGYVFVGLSVRTIPEDKMMRKNFGKEWDAYVQRVRYRLIPYIL